MSQMKSTHAQRRQQARQRKRRQRVVLIGIISLAFLGLISAAVFALRGSGSGQKNAVAYSPGTQQTAPEGRTPDKGKVFPDFQVTDVDGRALTRATFKGKPLIVWFTASYCEPCQAGARLVARFENQLGANPFNVLVLFVDPGDTTGSLKQWRRSFSRPDWRVALDSDLARRVGLRYLDTKFILDPAGVVKDVNFAQADDAYLTRLREVVGGSR